MQRSDMLVFVCEWVFIYLFTKIGAVDRIDSFRGDHPILIRTKQKPQNSQLMNTFMGLFHLCFSVFPCVCVSVDANFVCVFAMHYHLSSIINENGSP